MHRTISRQENITYSSPDGLTPDSFPPKSVRTDVRWRHKLWVNDIAMNMESCVITLKRRWPNAQIALSGLTYAPKGDNTKIDDINYCYEAICSEHNITYINNQRVTADTFGNIDPEVTLKSTIQDKCFFSFVK